MSHSRDGPGVAAPLRTNIVPLAAVWNPPLPLPPPPPLKSPRFNCHNSFLMDFVSLSIKVLITPQKSSPASSLGGWKPTARKELCFQEILRQRAEKQRCGPPLASKATKVSRKVLSSRAAAKNPKLAWFRPLSGPVRDTPHIA